jgi:hypothetical protein
MTRRCLPVAAVLLSLAAPAAATEPSPTAKEVRAAVVRALPLIEKGAAGHKAQRTCFACHHQAIPLLAMTTARGRGVAVNEEEIQKHLLFIAKFLSTNRANYLKGRGQGGAVDTAGYALWTLEMGDWRHDKTTSAVAEYVLLYRKDLDHWLTTSNRPPSEVSPFTTTYLAVRGLQTFGTPEQKERIAKRLGQARTWLTKAPARDTEDRVFRLWALKRIGADAEQVRRAARELLKGQRPDGGWAQKGGMESDAYATGSALVALHRAGGLATDDPAYQRGLKYLLGTQREDGTWYVRSRSRPFQVYFESGFPHGKDQFISLAASGWATTALALALPAAEVRPGRESLPKPRFDPEGERVQAVGLVKPSESPNWDAPEGTRPKGIRTGDSAKQKPEGAQVAKVSAWTWGYFFAAPDKAAVQSLFGEGKPSVTLYRVEKVVPVRGKPAVSLKAGSTVVRVETASRLPALGGGNAPTLLFHGVPQHLQYTTGKQRADLNKRSRPELPPGKDTVAVVIPIRKSAAWWALPHDERNAYFQKKGDRLGHTAIGAKYVERIYRKLYHTRYAVETTDHDFITYFEFDRAHTDAFLRMLAQLRDPQQNPEWNFVDREYEIWMTKVE